MKWKTNIKSNNRIIALSDIHGDIHSLIIALRDCAKVIKKKITNPDIIDYPVEILLEYDLNLDIDKSIPFYKDNLDYEWCGNNTFVVICGDFLDGFRNSFGNYRIPFIDSRCDKCMDLEYDQIEIKIFRFINTLNETAIKKGGRIFKILGNHEFINLNDESLNNYIPDWTKSLKNYYKGMTREEYFKLDNEGGKLIFKGGAGLLLIINGNIFVHGRLDHSKTYNNYKQINHILNILGNQSLKKRIIRELNSSCNLTIWGRKYNRNFNNYENEKDLSSNQHEKCKQIKIYLEQFINEIKTRPYNIEDIRVIVGHCPQYLNSNEYYRSTVNSSFNTIEKYENYEKLSFPVRTSKSDNDFIFGIGMECNKKDLDNPSKFPNYADNDDRIYYDNDDRFIYKIDVGSSRGFDQRLDKTIFTKLSEKGTIGARVSQVLEINKGIVTILRSTVKNTRIHQPRHQYEQYIKEKSISELYILHP